MRNVSINIIFTMILLLSPNGWAQQSADYQERRALVNELIELEGSRPNLEPIIDQMLQQMRAAILAKSPQREAEIDSLIASKLRPTMMNSLPAFYAEVDRIHAEVYTLEDLRASIAFLRTDAGKIFIDRQRRVSAKMQEAAGVWSHNFMGNLLKSLEQK
ncbi:hypothetical protein VZ95_20580 [Elstera litoralis]|uniref:DUF2059 domain-containing protein n=1 Tax=Elstera litoralis TaxID=552518 RepID=A0A0F3IJN2_9PROT|nr:DUF2059 domain-containing protein [Elstera litoralis]KJV06728.1 hypothetical protein VZ95_20580 [Elstera litoralis]